ncbi:hypothetical protein FNF31_07929 [Cafeteria roenbergensis]|uniref:Peptidase S54 rhomboid domain-containing protein n=1 Tax=Cafeteria roenbergensis TaxID=33653 RepID=A0A5A8BZG3_CAFRO|nr:hypothetical protein FNF31_07929 [Cafeteria roenbergensis]
MADGDATPRKTGAGVWRGLVAWNQSASQSLKAMLAHGTAGPCAAAEASRVALPPRRVLSASPEGGFDLSAVLDVRSPLVRFYFPTLAVNSAVFFAWRNSLRQNQGMRASPFLHSWFMTSPRHLRDLPWFAAPGHWLGSTFSHIGGLHLGVNMYALYSFAHGLLEGNGDTPTMSLGRFTTTYIAGGLAGAAASNLWGIALKSNIPSLGASGAVFAVATAYLQAVPGTGVRLAFVAPLEGETALIGLAVANVAIMAAQALRFRVGVDGAGHLGGMLAGLLAAEAWKTTNEWRGQVRHMFGKIYRRREERELEQLRTKVVDALGLPRPDASGSQLRQPGSADGGGGQRGGRA